MKLAWRKNKPQLKNKNLFIFYGGSSCLMDELVAFFELRVSGGGTPQCSAKKSKQQHQPTQQSKSEEREWIDEMEWKQLVEWMENFGFSWMKLMRQWNGINERGPKASHAAVRERMESNWLMECGQPFNQWMKWTEGGSENKLIGGLWALAPLCRASTPFRSHSLPAPLRAACPFNFN